MSFVNLSFRIHVPLRLRAYTAMDVEASHHYFDENATIEQLNFLAAESFIPATKLLTKLCRQYKGKFKVAFSISGTTLELLQAHRPDVLEQIKKLNKTNCLEFYGETYHHTLSSLYSAVEFAEQVLLHKTIIKNLFGNEPVVFRNTELIHQNKLAASIRQLGFNGILTEGVEKLLKGRDLNHLYTAPQVEEVKMLLRNHRMSDDLAFHFHEQGWSEHPLTSEKFASWVHVHQHPSQVITLFFDYATLGIHKKKETGIFDFIEALPAAVLANEHFKFANPSEIIEQLESAGTYDAPETISWKDRQEDHRVWCENMMQNNMLKKIYSLEKLVKATKDSFIIETWRKLQLADYFYYMSETEMVEKYQRVNPFCSAEEAYKNYFNIITDFEIQLIRRDLEWFRRKGSSLKIFIF
jgi:alpha-amylase